VPLLQQVTQSEPVHWLRAPWKQRDISIAHNIELKNFIINYSPIKAILEFQTSKMTASIYGPDPLNSPRTGRPYSSTAFYIFELPYQENGKTSALLMSSSESLLRCDPREELTGVR
jgi:hypothetical protein